ncbi:MAG: HAD family phosphatase [Ignavibacteriales bacterium]|nr:HAD family phosphatase [Ignavibacteriales bacterium]
MGQIKTLLFDLGNVLAYIDFNEFWRSLGLVRPEEIAPFADGYKSWTRQYETGFISTSEYLSGLQSVFGRRFNVKQLKQAFENIIQEPVDGMLDIVKHVSQEHRTALVSDTNEIHYRLSLKKLVVLSILQKHYLSYQLRVMKPARGFYDAIIKDQKIDPSEMLLIDDLITNVNGAQAAGMQAIKFENPAKLEKTLKDLGVLL